jgi:hypothetical protein
MHLLAHLARVVSGARARPGPPPAPERLERLARQICAGSYRVPPERIADAMLASPPVERRSGKGRRS